MITEMLDWHVTVRHCPWPQAIRKQIAVVSADTDLAAWQIYRRGLVEAAHTHEGDLVRQSRDRAAAEDLANGIPTKPSGALTIEGQPWRIGAHERAQMVASRNRWLNDHPEHSIPDDVEVVLESEYLKRMAELEAIQAGQQRAAIDGARSREDKVNELLELLTTAVVSKGGTK